MKSRVTSIALPLVGVLILGVVWTILAANVQDLPSPLKTWQESKIYILQPLDKRGEMDQGIVRLAYYSLVRVAKGFLLGILMGTPLGFVLGVSKTFNKMFDPVIQVLRPISPLAWLPLGLIVFQKSEPAALFTLVRASSFMSLVRNQSRGSSDGEPLISATLVSLSR